MIRRRCAIAGVVAVAVAVAATEAVAAILPGGQSLLAAVADVVIDLTPGPVVRLAISVLGQANRLVLLVSMVAVMLAAGAAIGVSSARRVWPAPIGFAGFGLLGAAGAVSAGVPVATALAAAGVGALAGSITLARLVRIAVAGEAPGHGAPGEPASRRVFLGWAGAAALAAAAMLAAGRLLQQERAVTASPLPRALPTPSESLPTPPDAAALPVEGVSPLFTPNDEFYRIDTSFRVPRVDPGSAVIRFTGMVDTPFELSYQQLLDEPTIEVDVTLACVSNEVGGDLVGNARWLGVPLARLLDRAGVRPGADQVVGRSTTGWTGGFPLEAAYDGRPAIVAIGMNGEPLPARHGFPARLVIAGLYGYVSATKWLSEVEVTTFDAFDAYWVPRGWSRLGPIKTQSRIDVPREGATVAAGTVTVAGVAWAGERGVSAVEVSVDEGLWRPAELAAELATTSWRQWAHRWDAPVGAHQLRVRATDGEGRTQTAERSLPAPDGATGYHAVNVSVS